VSLGGHSSAQANINKKFISLSLTSAPGHRRAVVRGSVWASSYKTFRSAVLRFGVQQRRCALSGVRVARARNLAQAEALIQVHEQVLGLIGEQGGDVLEINLALDRRH
jgi:hypothetical protein